MANKSTNSSRALKGEIFVIGDVHGCATELRQLLQMLPLDANSTVVFVGDYIDRGPDSKGVVDIILDFRSIYNVITLMGNHEELLLAFLEDPKSKHAGSFIYNGGSATLASYAQGQSNYVIPEEHLKFFKSLLLCYQTEDFYIVHAGVPDIALHKINPKRDKTTLLWIREKFLKSKFAWKKVIVHGHSVVQEVELLPGRINVDTGCVFMGKLSAIGLTSKKIYSIKRKSEVPHTYLRESGSHRVATRFTGHIPVRLNKDGRAWAFETVNYNEFGLLLRLVEPMSSPLLTVQEKVEGELEFDSNSIRKFTGEVVRIDKSLEGTQYAIKMQF